MKTLNAYFDDASFLDANHLRIQDNTYLDDFIFIENFLKAYSDNKTTFNAYRRELERLLQWCVHKQQKHILDLNRADIEAFIKFCQKPPKSWVGFNQVPRFISKDGERIPNPDWRPFVIKLKKSASNKNNLPDKSQYTLSQGAIQALFAILSSFYNFLIQEGHTQINPILHIRQKSKFIRKRQGIRPIRRLSELQWDYVIQAATQMADEKPEQHERTLFIMSTLYGMYLRISELCTNEQWMPQMGHFYRDPHDNWWFKTVGKGNKERDITVSFSMLNALKRYRKFLGLTPLPSPGETTPLIPKLIGKGGVSDTRHIRHIVQMCFDKGSMSLAKDKHTEEAEQLKSATVHWLRHTGISEDVKHRPREHVRDDAGHSSSAITDRYIDVELLERHQSGKKKQIIPENESD